MTIVYNIKVFEGAITGAGGGDVVLSPAEMNGRLAQAERFAVFARVAQVSGTSPTLTVLIDHSNDNINWTNKSTPIDAEALTAGQLSMIYGSDDGSTVGGAYHRVVIGLGADLFQFY